MDFSKVGIWSADLRFGDRGEAAEAAAELEELGFGALWFPDGGGPVLDAARNLLAATRETVVATGILNLWMHEPAEVADGYAALTGGFPDRFLMGIGVSHAPAVDQRREPGTYRRPMAATKAFLDAHQEGRVVQHHALVQGARVRSRGCAPASRAWPCRRRCRRAV